MAVVFSAYLEKIQSFSESSEALSSPYLLDLIRDLAETLRNDILLRAFCELCWIDPVRYPELHHKLSSYAAASDLAYEYRDFAVFLQDTFYRKNVQLFSSYLIESRNIRAAYNFEAVAVLEVEQPPSSNTQSRKKIRLLLESVIESQTDNSIDPLSHQTLRGLVEDIFSYNYQKIGIEATRKRYQAFLDWCISPEGNRFQEALLARKTKRVAYYIGAFFADKELVTRRLLATKKAEERDDSNIYKHVLRLIRPGDLDKMQLFDPEYWKTIKQYLHHHSYSSSVDQDPCHGIDDLPLIEAKIVHPFLEANVEGLSAGISVQYCEDVPKDFLDLMRALANHFYEFDVSELTPLAATVIVDIRTMLHTNYLFGAAQERAAFTEMALKSEQGALYCVQPEDMVFTQNVLGYARMRPYVTYIQDNLQALLLKKLLSEKKESYKGLDYIRHAVAYCVEKQYDLYMPISYEALVCWLIQYCSSEGAWGIWEIFCKQTFRKLDFERTIAKAHRVQNFKARAQRIWKLIVHQGHDRAKEIFEGVLVQIVVTNFYDWPGYIEVFLSWSTDGANYQKCFFDLNAQSLENIGWIEFLCRENTGIADPKQRLHMIWKNFSRHITDRSLRFLIEAIREYDISRECAFNKLSFECVQVVFQYNKSLWWEKDSHNYTLMYYAMVTRNTDLVNHLFAAFYELCDQWAKNPELSSERASAYISAIQNQEFTLSQKILDSGDPIDFSSPVSEDKSLFQYLVDSRNYSGLTIMVSEIASQRHFYDVSCEHPVFYAIKKSDIKAIQILAPLYKSALTVNENNMNALEYAVSLGQLEVIFAVEDKVMGFLAYNSVNGKSLLTTARQHNVDPHVIHWILRQLLSPKIKELNLSKIWFLRLVFDLCADLEWKNIIYIFIAIKIVCFSENNISFGSQFGAGVGRQRYTSYGQNPDALSLTPSTADAYAAAIAEEERPNIAEVDYYYGNHSDSALAMIFSPDRGRVEGERPEATARPRTPTSLI